MSRKWTPSIYRTHDAQTSAPDVGEIDSLLRAVEVYSGRLRSSPYDHHLWLGRARCYLALNYPELAVGDAYKAGLLLDEHEDAAGGDMNLTRMHVHSVVSQALYDCHCHCELVEFWDEVSAAFPSEHASKEAIRMKQLLKQKKEASYPLGGTRWEQRDRVRDGGTVTVTYPWMEERHLTRSSALVEKINGELGDDIEQRSCTLGRSTLDSRDNMLGMFAAKNIQPGECVLIDRPATGATSSPDDSACGNCYGFVPSQPISAPCCAVVYCSSACLDLAMSSYHRLLCGQNFDWLQQPAIGLTHNASPLRPLLMLRLLAICVQAGVDKHPLDHSLIARLQPLLDCAHVDVFTFNESVKTPIKILQQLGVDVFAAHNLDTMVLHTIWTRLANNKAGSSDPMRGFIDEISSHLPLFNHSCESNVEWKREDGSTVISFFAKRAIAKDEELFSSYIEVQNMSLEQRTQALWPWFEEPCLCSRCRRERTAVPQAFMWHDLSTF